MYKFILISFPERKSYFSCVHQLLTFFTIQPWICHSDFTLSKMSIKRFQRHQFYTVRIFFRAKVTSSVHFINIFFARVFCTNFWRQIYEAGFWVLNFGSKNFIHKMRTNFFYEIDNRPQFHQCSMSSFCALRLPKCKKTYSFVCFWDLGFRLKGRGFESHTMLDRNGFKAMPGSISVPKSRLSH